MNKPTLLWISQEHFILSNSVCISTVPPSPLMRTRGERHRTVMSSPRHDSARSNKRHQTTAATANDQTQQNKDCSPAAARALLGERWARHYHIAKHANKDSPMTNVKTYNVPGLRKIVNTSSNHMVFIHSEMHLHVQWFILKYSWSMEVW